MVLGDLLLYSLDYVDYLIIIIGTSVAIYIAIYSKSFLPLFVYIILLVFVPFIIKNDISDGIYMANFVEINGQVIGNGTKESKSFRFEKKHHDYIVLAYHKQYDYDSQESSAFVECYTYKNIETICVNPLGLAEIINKHDSNKKSILYIDN